LENKPTDRRRESFVRLKNPPPKTATNVLRWCLSLGRHAVYFENMKRVWKIAFCLAGGLALNAGLHADNVAFPDNPYAAIVVRNVFGLNPPPPPVDPNAPPPEPEVKITANGIMAIMGQAEALYKTTVAGKPDQSYMLAEGQREDDIEVVKIDEKARSVTFNNHGVVQEIPLANTTDSGKGGSSAQRGPIFGSVSGIPLPAFPTAGGANGASAFPPPAGFGGGPGTGANNGTSLPFGTTTHATTTTSSEPAMTQEQQLIMIEANRLITEQQVINGEMPPLPPTIMTPPDAKSIGGAPLGGVEPTTSPDQPSADPTSPASP